jgi:type 1 glutamine amidotransferase
MSKRALIVGGCPAPYHRIEAAAPPIRTALESLSLSVQVTGIFHPDGGDAYTGDYSSLTREGLADVDLLVLYTTGNQRHGAEIGAIREFVEAGRALVGIHNAADTFTDDPDFVSLIGGKFRTHPAQLDITTEIVDRTHPITDGITDFTVHDELYLFSDYDPSKVHLLAQTRSYDDNGPVPIAWTREPGTGRIFYISLGHNPSTLADANWQHFFKNGVQWAVRSSAS